MPVQFPILKNRAAGPGPWWRLKNPVRTEKRKEKELMLLRDFRYPCATFLLFIDQDTREHLFQPARFAWRLPRPSTMNRNTIGHMTLFFGPFRNYDDRR
jgi:hypothetical protein